MGFLPAKQYLALPRSPNSWVIEDILPVSGLLNIYGKPKSHKSFLALQIAAAVASGGQIPDVLGFPIHEYGPVAYLQVDTPRVLWADRLVDWFPNADDVHLADAESEGLPYPFDIMKEGFNWLKDAVAETKPVVVIIDTLREIHAGDENDSTHMRNFVGTIQAAVRPAACIVLSHARKNQNESFEIMNENRGSGYVAGRMDAVLYLGKEKVIYHSRTAGETTHEIVRTPMVELKDPIGAMAARLVRKFPKESQAALTEKLLLRFPDQSREAARTRIRTAQDKPQH